LSARELLQGGIDRPETRTPAEIIEANRWQPVVTRPAVDPNPWVANEAQVDSIMSALHPRRETTKQFIRRAANEYQDRLDAAESANADAARRASAVAHAEAHLEKMRFSADASRGDVERASQMLRQAKEGDLSAYRTMSEAVTADEQAKFDQKQAEHNLRVAAALEELEYSKPTPIFEGTPGVGPGQSVHRMLSADSEVSYRIVDGDRVVQEWSEADAPAEIVEAAK
jgi:hypothetical protein